MANGGIIRIGWQLRRELDEYLKFGFAVHHQQLDRDEVASVVVWNFLDDDEAFAASRRGGAAAIRTLQIEGRTENEAQAQRQRVTSCAITARASSRREREAG